MKVKDVIAEFQKFDPEMEVMIDSHEDVSTFALEGETLLVVFTSGRTRNYPLMHLWYYESHVGYHAMEPLVDLDRHKRALLNELPNKML